MAGIRGVAPRPENRHAYAMYLIRLCVALVSLSVAGGELRAQEVGWTSVPTPTAQTLWGVAYGNGRFVAVGEGGAIVYSDGSDGTRWTAALGITNRWLVDIGRSQPLHRFVAVRVRWDRAVTC